MAQEEKNPLIFICPCILNIIPNYNQQDETFLNLSISTDALHVSGGSSAHHQEHIQLQVLSTNTAAIVDDMERSSISSMIVTNSSIG
jgi:sporulation-control protein spo0M